MMNETKTINLCMCLPVVGHLNISLQELRSNQPPKLDALGTCSHHHSHSFRKHHKITPLRHTVYKHSTADPCNIISFSAQGQTFQEEFFPCLHILILKAWEKSHCTPTLDFCGNKTTRMKIDRNWFYVPLWLLAHWVWNFCLLLSPFQLVTSNVNAAVNLQTKKSKAN